jgi:hypothetical protein
MKCYFQVGWDLLVFVNELVGFLEKFEQELFKAQHNLFTN